MISSPVQPETNVIVNAVGNTQNSGSGYSVYQIIGVVIVFTILAAVLSYSKNVFTFDVWGWFKSNILIHIPYFNTDPLIIKGESAMVQAREDLGMKSTPLTYPDAESVKKANDGNDIVASAPEPPPVASASQTWCLVGEDMTGRWCVQVQTEKSCDKDRTYTSKNECEKPKK
jgi:hypothetical protein